MPHGVLNVEKLGGFLLLSGVIILCFYSFVELKRILPAEIYHDDAVFFIALILCIAWGGDTAAYFAGRFFGKHKLAPEVSPKKTVEGAIGGIISSLVVTVIIVCAFGFVNKLPLALLFTVPLCIIGMIGDLFASSIKRAAGIKDYGDLIPGHGGVLDRVDSILMIAPLMLVLVMLGVFG